MSAVLPSFGLMAEFDDPEQLVDATRRAYLAGYRRMDAFAPYEVENLSEALGERFSWVPVIMFVGGVAGVVTGYVLQWWVAAVAYPIDVAGKPFNSWPMFVPVMFELGVLFSCLAGLFGMLILNGLPMPNHPAFNVPRFAAHASQDGFFLLIEADDPRFDSLATRRMLESAGAVEVNDVPR